MKKTEFLQKFESSFGKHCGIVVDRTDMNFLGTLLSVEEADGGLDVTLFLSGYMDATYLVTSIEEQDFQWILHTADGSVFLRHLSPEDIEIAETKE